MNYYYRVYYIIPFDKKVISRLEIFNNRNYILIRVPGFYQYKNPPYLTIKIKNTIILDMISNKRYVSCHDIFDILVKEDVKLLMNDESNILTNVNKPR